MTTFLSFDCPVVVEVDHDTRQVRRVVVIDDTPAAWLPNLSEDERGSRVRLARHRQAVEIAESAGWPAWEFGW